MPTSTQPVSSSTSRFSFYLQDIEHQESRTEALSTPFSRRALYSFLRDTTDKTLPTSCSVEDLSRHAARHGYRLFMA